MVEIYINPAPGEESFEGAIVFGTIIVLQSNFVYVVADPVRFRENFGSLRIDCPGGQILRYPRPSIHFTEDIVGICCPDSTGYDTELMLAVPLCRSDIAKSQNVHVFSAERNMLTTGTVMGVRGRYFQHNCSALIHSAFGAPVVDDKGCLVGICKDFRSDYLEAISTTGIASEIEKAQGRRFTDIGRMLKHLRKQKRKRDRLQS